MTVILARTSISELPPPAGHDVAEPAAEHVETRSGFQRKLVYSRSLPERLAEQLWAEPDRLIANGTWLKEGRRCTVVRIESAGRPFVLKRYNLRGKLHSAAHAVLKSRAAGCWDFGRALRLHGINSPQPRAYVENRVGPLRGRSYLLTDFVVGVALDRAVALSPVGTEAFERLRSNVAELWQRMGVGRLSHGDTKPANFLVAADGSLWVIDLDAMRQHRSAATFRRARVADRERFLKDWRQSPEIHAVFGEAVPLENGQESLLWIEPAFRPAMQAAGLTDFDAVQSTTAGRMLRRLPDRENWRLDLPDPTCGVRGAYLKRHRAQSAELSRSWRPKPSEGRVEAETIRRMDAVGVPTMTLIAFGERFTAEHGEESFIVTDELRGYTQLDEFLEQRFDWDRPRRDADLERLIARVAGVAARFHEMGFNHRDFYCCHFFVREEPTGQFDVRLIDLQRVQHRRVFRGRWLIKDMAQLAYSAGRHCIGARQRLRFYRQYRGIGRLSDADKRFIRRILARETQMLVKLGPYK